MIARVPLFAGLDAAEISDIMQLLRAQRAEAGQVIVRAGEPAHAMFFIAAGEVEVALPDRQVPLGAGQFFGEVSVLRRGRRSATVTAVTRANLLILEAEDLHALMQRNGRVAARVKEVVETRVGREVVSANGHIVAEESTERSNDRRCGSHDPVPALSRARQSRKVGLCRPSGRATVHAEGIKPFITFLIVAGILVPLFHRVRIGTVLGFLIAGVVLGPQGLGRFVTPDNPLIYLTFDNPQRGAPLAEFGIIILLFLLGLELSLRRLWQLRRYVLGAGLVQVAITTAAIGLAIYLFGGTPAGSFVLGLCLALSSTAIVMQILTGQGRAGQPIGLIALSVLLLQDMMVVPILFMVGMLGGTDHPGSYALVAVLPAFALALGVVIAMLLAGRFLLGPMLHEALRTGSRDLIMAVALLIVVAASLATGAAGLSPALGAFLAGMLLSDSESRHQIEVDLEPFKGLLLGIFFIAVGTSLDVVAVLHDALWIAGAVLLLMAIKSVMGFVAARAFGAPRSTAAEVGLLLSQGGEFAFVVIGVAGKDNLLSPRIAAGTVAVVAISMMLTPVAAILGRLLAARLAPVDHGLRPPGADIAELKDHIVIGGCGRIGQMIASALELEGVAYVCLDTNADAVAEMRKAGRPAFYGDATRIEFLERIGAAHARAFVVTIARPRSAERMVSAARQVNRHAFIFARAGDAQHAARLVKRGALGVIPDSVEASLQLATRVLEGLDLPDEAVVRRISDMRDAEVAKLDEAEAAA